MVTPLREDLSLAPAPSRRWLRFGLRTLLALTTLVGVWLGLQVDTVNRRRDWIENMPAGTILGYNDYQSSPPQIRKWMGDRTYAVIGLPHGTQYTEIERVKSLFPESTVMVLDPPNQSP